MVNPISYKMDVDNITAKFTLPGRCPFCGLSMKPVSIDTVGPARVGDRLVYIFKITCSVEKCGKLYISMQTAKSEISRGSAYYVVNQILQYPGEWQVEFQDTIKNKFPKFVQAYNDAMEVKSTGKTDLAGCGLRRALELLIHDYALMFYPEDKEFIENPKTTLADKISKYCDSPDIKNVAKAGSWLGNDFTHPVKRHNQTVEQLIQYVDTCVLFISHRLVARNAADFIAGRIEPQSAESPETSGLAPQP